MIFLSGQLVVEDKSLYGGDQQDGRHDLLKA